MDDALASEIKTPSPVPNPKKRKRSKTRKPYKIPNQEQAIIIKPCLTKYWNQRYSLFSKYDAGIQMDDEGWFSVTPESIAAVHAARAAGGAVVIDCFSGVGGNAIQFAARNCRVVAIEIDARKVAYAVNNAKIYGVEGSIDFVIGDFFRLAPFLKGPFGVRMRARIRENRMFFLPNNIFLQLEGYFSISEGDVVFLSPPWGGPSYSKIQNFTLDMLKPKDGYSIFQVAQKISPNIIMFLPRNVDLNQVEELSWLSSPPLNLEIEENHVQTYMKGITAYFGDTASAALGLS